jgi:hypothetical protein
MEIKINALIPRQNHFHWVHIFGYTSRSQPGLEITGIGPKGRAIKEKLIFLSKKRKLKFSLNRFVLCIEGSDGFEKAELEYLELPLLLAFWSMAGLIPIKRLENCFCSGRVGLEGEISCLNLSCSHWSKINEALIRRKRKAIYFGESIPLDSDHLNLISPLSLLHEAVGGFSLESDFSQMDSALARSVK